MTRENAAAKARRYLTEGRLIVERVSPYLVASTCRGDGAVYRQRWSPAGDWDCNCPARTPRCAHLDALRLVTAVDLVGPPASASHDHLR